MDQTNWQLIEGVKALKNLIDMLGEALSATNIKIYGRSPAWEWMGYYLEGKKFFVGVYYDKPNLIILNTEVALNDNIPEEPKKGRYVGNGWQNELDLQSESVHFFSRSKASQETCLEEFVKESINYGKQLIEP